MTVRESVACVRLISREVPRQVENRRDFERVRGRCGSIRPCRSARRGAAQRVFTQVSTRPYCTRACPRGRSLDGDVGAGDVGAALRHERAGRCRPLATRRPTRGSGERMREGERRRNGRTSARNKKQRLFSRDSGLLGPRQHARAHRAEGPAAPGRRCVAAWIARPTEEVMTDARASHRGRARVTACTARRHSRAPRQRCIPAR